LYFGIAIGLSFFKTMSNFNGINLNPLSIINDFKNHFNHALLLAVTNTLLYVPLGIYIRFKVKISNFKLFIGFLLYILLIEVIQNVSHRGIFDINDIILNTLGFFIGVLCSNFIMKIPTKQNIESDC
jgi:glycopeptide antibiotics resistance protein